ncbi:2Fe-2S iron-sulfur cluster-binding protein [Klebsiella aerogenes]|uniref:2Fe-2S iron-sulfur cluster-binding protein n=1 Tax=Klebsiella aerogenes TaxID=548 RepID=UPI00224C1EF2|nr:2Fe-2S iron-sulfur cluster-binding protein [Klebsiella aerogenes]
MRFGCKTGNCGLCRVKVLSGMENITGKTLKEKRLFKLLGIEDQMVRLTCQCKIRMSPRAAQFLTHRQPRH